MCFCIIDSPKFCCSVPNKIYFESTKTNKQKDKFIIYQKKKLRNFKVYKYELRLMYQKNFLQH